MIEVKNVSKRYDDNIVLNNISFNINQSEIVGLVGPNGVGNIIANVKKAKTTTVVNLKKVRIK